MTLLLLLQRENCVQAVITRHKAKLCFNYRFVTATYSLTNFG